MDNKLYNIYLIWNGANYFLKVSVSFFYILFFFPTLEALSLTVFLSLSIYFFHAIVNVNEQSQLKMSHLSKNVIEISMSSLASVKHHNFLWMICLSLPIT